ncbi:MAG: hypothetical protein AAB477_02845 [Patescibacteria group bacterium]
MINTEYLKNLISETINDELATFEKRKDEADFLTSSLRFSIAMFSIALHICLRPDPYLFERPSAVIISLILGWFISRRVFEKKMERLTFYWDDLNKLVEHARQYFDFQSVEKCVIDGIEEDVHKTINKKYYRGFITSNAFYYIVHVSALGIGLVFFLTIPDTLFWRRGLFSLFLAYFLSETVLTIKNIKVL